MNTLKQHFNKEDLSKWFVILFALLILLPILQLAVSFLNSDTDTWLHFTHNILAQSVKNTISLTICVAAISFIIGIGLAWFVSHYVFWGSRTFKWGLMLPMAYPLYVLSFINIGIYDYTGPVQTFLRSHDIVQTFKIRSFWGMVFTYSLCLYPYIYFLSLSGFTRSAKVYNEVCQSLGVSGFNKFFKVYMPLTRPWFLAGLTLVVLECLTDFGGVSVFNFETLSVSIYRAWFGHFSVNTASRIACLLVFVSMTYLYVENFYRMKPKYRFPAQVYEGVHVLKQAKALNSFLMTTLCTFVFAFAFIIPSFTLCVWFFDSLVEQNFIRHLNDFWHSSFIGLTTAGFVTISAFIMAYGSHLYPSKLKFIFTRIATLGYAIPGAVLAIAIYKTIFNIKGAGNVFFNNSIYMTNSLWVLVFALGLKFLLTGYQAISSGVQKINKNISEAAQSLGTSGYLLIKRIYYPIVKKDIFIGFILVFVEVIKEMPITLMLRPYGWNTLSISIFEYTSEGDWLRASLPSILLVVVGFIPLYFLSSRMDENNV